MKWLSTCKDHTDKLCRINVDPTANHVLRCDNFIDLIYTSKQVSVTATYWFLAHCQQWPKFFAVLYRFVGGHYCLVCTCSGAPNSMTGVAVRLRVERIQKHPANFLAAAANLIHQQ
jgi:hypothetical protein